MTSARVSTDVRRILPFALYLCACGGNAGPTPRTPNQLEGRQVARVVVEGNKAISDSALIKGLAHRRPKGFFKWSFAKYSAPALALDRKRIETYYRARGYFNARVNSTNVSRLGQRVQIVFFVFEGTPARIVGVLTNGIPPDADVDADGIAADAQVAPGRRIIHQRYLDLKTRLLQAVHRAGYAHAKIDGEIRVHREQHTAEVVIDVDAGPRVKFGEVHVIGNSRVPDEAVENRVAFGAGDPFDPDKLEQTVERVRELGTFSSVRTDYARDGRPPVADTYIRVNERLRHEIKAGGGVAIDGVRTEVRLRGEYENRMSVHPLVTLRAGVRPGFVVYDNADVNLTGDFVIKAEASIQRQDLLFPLLSATATAEFDIENFEAYSTTGPSTGIRLARPFFGRRLTASAGWQFSYLFDVSPKADDEAEADAIRMALGISDADAPYRIGYLVQSLALDLRDNPVSARSGIYAQIGAEQGHAAVGSNFDYQRVTGELRGYVPATSWLVIAARARTGSLRTNDDLDQPFTRRFYSGGSSTHRGFNFRRLSPPLGVPGASGPPVGGNGIIETGVETRMAIGTLFDQKLTLGVFLDGGDVAPDYSDVELTNLHWAAGIGFRIDTPLGPIRVDAAYRLNRAAGLSTFDRMAFHLLSVGEAF